MLSDLEAQQHREIEVLRERVRQLEDALAPATVRVPVEWCLTGAEHRVFAHLVAHEECSKQSIMMALYSDRLEEPEIKIVDVFICKLRKKLKAFGVEIVTLWGRGYALPPDARAAYRVAQ